MKKTNFTIHERSIRKALTCFLLLAFASVYSTSLSAQCSLACNGFTNVSLDDQCEATITPEMILNDNATSCPGGAFIVEVMEDMDGDPIPTSPMVNNTYVGETLFVKVMDTDSGNSCWGEILVEDKIAPTIDCPAPTGPIFCFDLVNYEPTATDNCDPDPEVTFTNEIITPNNCDGSLPDDVIMRIERTYIATDASGMTSDPCSVTLDVQRIESLDDIVAPMSFILDNALECSGNYPIEENGNPDVSFTGVPTLNDIDLFPTPFAACNIVVTKEDVDLPPIGCVKKIMRIFNIVEWSCGDQRTREIVQMIEIVDDEGPIITECPNNMIASTGNYECTGMVNLPPVEAMDLCSETIEVDIAFPGGFLDNMNGGLAELPLGDNIVTYTVYDECLNSTTCSIVVTVDDFTPPVAVCDQFTAVGVTNDGFAHVYATVFDDGSYDECELERMLVRRMDTNTCGDCPAPEFTGFESLGKFNGHYYYLSDQALTGRLAAKHAVALGGYALSIETAAENNWISSVIPDEVDFYIGLQNNGGSTYTWASGAELTNTDWAIGQPSDNDPYVIFSDDLEAWDDVDGFDEYRYIVEVPEECSYSESTVFCCADIGEDNMVIFRVIDAACNFNECMVNVDVQDKIGPVVACPADITVSCDTPYDIDNLSQFGEATVFDNCGFTMEETVTTDFDQCQTGDLVRTFTVTDDGGRVSSCSQVITFEFDFGISGNEIIFPPNVTMSDGCDDPSSPEYDPINTGLPIYPDVPCQLLGLNIDDQVFIFNGEETDACFKILRTFTVINWCESDPITGIPETYVGTQVIKVNNTVKPVITGSCERVMVCTYDAECEDGAITLTQTATDDCTEELNYHYQIDAFNDGVFDGPQVSGVGNMADASGIYPIGSHRIVWTFFDRCGNATSCEQLFDVVNCKAPTPYCLSGLAIDLMPVDNDGDGETDGGMIDIWANDFDAGSAHPCGYPVVLSFSEDTSNTSIIFDCSDVGEVELNVWSTAVSPDGQLLQAFCVTYVDVQDNMEVCGDDNMIRPVIDGTISTVYDDMLDDVKVELQGDETIHEMTTDGSYAFPEMPTGGDYMVDPTKNDDVNNGVSTLDLVLIQRHILGLAEFSTPYELLAADINKDNKVTSADVIELRKVILGINDEFQSNESWRFIDANYTFEDPTSPWSAVIPETYEIENLSNDMTIDFKAIKVGDINNSVELANATSETTEVRSSNTFDIELDMNVAMIGETKSIPVYATRDYSVAGLQMTLDIDRASFLSVEGAALDITEANIGKRYSGRGLITVSWDQQAGQEITTGELLFTIVVDQPEAQVNITSEITDAEAFGTSLEVMTINATTRDASLGIDFELMQNEPNPFKEFTTISFRLPADMSATLKIYDMSGRVLRSITDQYQKGENTVRVNQYDLQASGVLHYQLTAGDFTANKKMVVIK